MTRIAFAAAALVTLTGPALAQQSAKDTLASFGLKIAEPLSPKQQDAVRKKVAAELARSGAAAWFDDATDETGGKARHRPSGLVCPLGAKGQRVASASADGAVCETRNGATLYETYVVKAPADATLDSVTAAARALAEAEPGYSQYRPGMTVTAHPRPGSGRPDHRTLDYVSRIGGHDRISHVQVGVVRDWVLTVRRITDRNAPPAGFGELLGEASFGREMGD